LVVVWLYSGISSATLVLMVTPPAIWAPSNEMFIDIPPGPRRFFVATSLAPPPPPPLPVKAAAAEEEEEEEEEEEDGCRSRSPQVS